MVLLKLLVFTLTFNELIVNLDATICPKGQSVTRTGGCQDCNPGYFQDVENYSRHCKACTRCNDQSGSFVQKECTKKSNTVCRCRGEFVPSDSDYSTCKCDIGFGLKHRECFKCDDGYFSTEIDSTCQKWKDCKSAGENITGTKTSDVICNKDSNAYVTKPPTTNKIVSPITRVTSHRPHEGAQTLKTHTTTTTSSPGPTLTPKNKVQSFHPSNTSSHIGMILIFIMVGLLVLTAVTCKLHITSCMKRRIGVQKNESSYRRPVEEIGDGSESSDKLNPGEP